MSIQELLTSMALALFIVLVPMLLLFLRAMVKNSEISLKKGQIELEMFRKSLENQVYVANDKIADNKERWEDINHMLYESARRDIGSARDKKNQFLYSLSIEAEGIKIDHDSAFLLAPINSRYEKQVKLIKSACGDLGIDCKTADEEFLSGPILSVIVKKILAASMVIAIIDGRNPNVFYELGLAHAFGKTVVMVSGGVEDIPFDIQSQRMVVVDWEDQNSLSKVRKALAESIRWANKASSKG